MAVSCIGIASENRTIIRYSAQYIYMQTNGFTLLELLITLAIGAILMFIGIPGIQSLITDSAIQAEVFSFHNAFHRARSYAIDQHTDVIACMANEQEECTEHDFSHLLIFSDKEKVRELSGNKSRILIRHQYTKSALTVTTNQRYFVFQPDGTQAGTPGTISLCGSNENKGIGLTIAMSGRVRQQNIVCDDN